MRPDHLFRCWFFTALVVFPGVATAQNAYFCVADAASGVEFDKKLGRWVAKIYNTDDNKYVLRKPSEKYDQKFSVYQWIFVMIKNDFVVTSCRTNFIDNEFLDCNDGHTYGRLLFNKRKKMFQFYWSSSSIYNNNHKATEASPSIEIGRCVPL